MKCDNYLSNFDKFGNRIEGTSYCYIAKSSEPCDCEGDMSRCIYEEIRNKSDNHTVKALKDMLNQYSEDLSIKVVVGNKIRPLSFICTGVDMDTNETSIWLVGKD